MQMGLKKVVYSILERPLTKLSVNQSATIGLSYHRFEKNPGDDPKPGMAVTTDTFRRHLDILGRVGRFVSMDDAVNAGSAGIRFFLCFDDGYGDNATVLLPTLEERKIPCCIFVVTDFVAGRMKALEHDARAGYCPPPLSMNDLRALAAHPLITLGSHSARHRRLSDLSAGQVRAEVEESRSWLQGVIGRKVLHFAAPFGRAQDLDWPLTARCLIEADYQSLVSNFGGVNRADRVDGLNIGEKRLVHLRRVPMPNTMEPCVVLGWTMGMCNLRERLGTRRYLPTV